MDLHVVALSGGKDSTAMALRLKELNPDQPYTYIITPTGDELPEMYNHWHAISEMLGAQLTPIVHPRLLRGLIADQNALPNWRQRWCTRMLKIEPYAAWLMTQCERHDRVISYVGLRADEPDREGGDYSRVPGVVMEFPMREWGWGLADVLAFLKDRRVTIPWRTDFARCFFQTLNDWYRLWSEYPDIWEDACRDEDRTGYTFRSPQRDTWPAGLRDLATEFAKGRIPKPKRDAISLMQCRVCRT